MKVRDASHIPFAAANNGVYLDYGEHPHTVQRHCTDCPCCLLFLLAMVAFIYVLLFSLANGDPDRFLGLPNTEGQFCGVSDGVKGKPLLYFCQGDRFPDLSICVSSCPDPLDGANSKSACPGLVEDYRTRPLGGLLCVPRDTSVTLELAEALDKPSFMWLREFGSLFRSWEILLSSAVVSAVLGFAYLFVLEECGCCIMWSGMVSVVVVASSFGVYLVHTSLRGGADGMPGTGDSRWDFLAGVGLCAFSLSFACLACCQAESAGAAIRYIQDASACIGDVRSLLFQPVVEVICKSALMLALASGFVYLASCVQFSPHKEVMGHSYTIEFDPEDYAFIGFYAFMSLWMLQICGAYSKFVISYVAQLWYVAERSRGRRMVGGVPLCPTLRGYVVGLCYHLGTFAYGSLILTAVRIPRDIMLLAGAENQNNPNPVTACCSCCCGCCLDCFNRFLRFMTKSAYMDTAMNSNDFCKAAYHSGMILMHYSPEVKTLNVTTLVFQIAGFGGISAAAGVLTHIVCRRIPRYSHMASPHYVEYPLLLDIVAAVIAAFVAWPFMVLLDHVSDTLIFCSAVEKMRMPPPRPEFSDEEEEPTCICMPARSLRNNPSRAGFRSDPEMQALLRRG